MFNKSDEIIDRLELLDILCMEDNVEAELVVLGAAGILLCMELVNRTFRPTRDIDVNLLSSSNKDRIHQLLREVEVDTVGGVMELPPMEDFEGDNLFKISGIDFEAINVFVPSIEMLACSKIFSTRQKDLQDLQKTDILLACNKDKLLSLVEEYTPHMLNPNNPDSNIHSLENILLEKGI